MSATVTDTQIIRTRLREVFRTYSSGELATLLRCSKRTVEHAPAGRAMPRTETLAAAMQRNKELRRRVWVGLLREDITT